MNEALLKQIKTKLQEYWVNELHLPLEIQLKSMAIMDITLENCLKTKSTRKESHGVLEVSRDLVRFNSYSGICQLRVKVRANRLTKTGNNKFHYGNEDIYVEINMGEI